MIATPARGRHQVLAQSRLEDCPRGATGWPSSMSPASRPLVAAHRRLGYRARTRGDFRTPDIGTKSRCVVFRSFDPENAFRVRGFCQCDALHTQRLVTHSRRKTSQYFEETIGMSGGLESLTPSPSGRRNTGPEARPGVWTFWRTRPERKDFGFVRRQRIRAWSGKWRASGRWQRSWGGRPVACATA